MWIYRKILGKYQIGYLIGLDFSCQFEIDDEVMAQCKVHFLNGGNK
jgi:hypothetical protein